MEHSVTRTQPRLLHPLRQQTMLNNRFCISETIGQGGLSQVYRAYDSRNCAFVVLKVMATSKIHPRLSFFEQRDLFIHEAAILRLVQVSCVPRLRSAHLRGWPIFLVTDAVDAEPLDKWLDRQSLSHQQALQLFNTIAKCVMAIHQQAVPIAHLDLKPENVLIDARGRVWLIDFNCAQTLFKGVGVAPLRGTPPYAAPEQWVPGHFISVRSDIYALGHLLDHLLPTDNRDRAVVAAIVRATRYHPRDRYKSVNEFRMAVRRASAPPQVSQQKVASRVRVRQPKLSKQEEALLQIIFLISMFTLALAMIAASQGTSIISAWH